MKFLPYMRVSFGYLTMKWFDTCIAAGVMLSLAPTSHAASLTDEAKAILESIDKQFSRIHALSFDSEILRDPNAELLPPEITAGPKNGTFSFSMAGKSYLIDDRSATGPNASKAYRKVAFDGVSYQYWDEEAGRLYISILKENQERPKEEYLRFSNFFLQAFEFAFGDDAQRLELADLTDHKMSESLSTRYLGMIATPQDANKIILAFSEGAALSKTNGRSYRVSFSTDGEFFPLGWKLVGPGGETIRELTITKTIKIAGDSGNVFSFPLELIRISYEGLPEISHRPVITEHVKFRHFKVNDMVETEEGAFVIDPSQAEDIWDGQSRILINVPR